MGNLNSRKQNIQEGIPLIKEWIELKRQEFENNDDFNELERIVKEIEKDQLIIIEEGKIKITEAGRPFVRNICMAFDLHLKRKSPETNLFSMTV